MFWDCSVIDYFTTSEIDNCNDKKKNILYNYLNDIQYSFVGKNIKMEKLAALIISTGILPQKSFDDCCHIALAVLHNCDIIVSWNFKHLVNPKTIRGVRAITIAEGYNDVIICDPLMLIGGIDHDS